MVAHSHSFVSSTIYHQWHRSHGRWSIRGSIRGQEDDHLDKLHWCWHLFQGICPMSHMTHDSRKIFLENIFFLVYFLILPYLFKCDKLQKKMLTRLTFLWRIIFHSKGQKRYLFHLCFIKRCAHSVSNYSIACHVEGNINTNLWSVHAAGSISMLRPLLQVKCLNH